MAHNLNTSTVKINIQIPLETKKKLVAASSLEGKKISSLVRESIEEKLERINCRIFEEKMKSAYQDLAQENILISEDFQYVDGENLPQ